MGVGFYDTWQDRGIGSSDAVSSHNFLRNWSGPRPQVSPIAVPTTAGTASEITPGAIQVAGDGQTKVAVMDNKLRAQVAVIDPELTVSCPPYGLCNRA